VVVTRVTVPALRQAEQVLVVLSVDSSGV
jgi:hypothetical protein